MPTCLECKKNVFDTVDGRLVCVECYSIVPDQLETLHDYTAPGSKICSATIKTPGPKSLIGEPKKQVQEWCLYDGFNFILVKMTDALIKCGAPPKIKACVHQLWAAYLHKIGVAYCQTGSTSGISQTQNQCPEDQGASIIPDWFSQPTEQDSQEETEVSDGNRSLLFAPTKVPLKKRKQAKSTIENLKDTPDMNLTALEVRRKKKQIRDSFMKLALSGTETDADLADTITTAETEGLSDDTLVQQTRLSTIKDSVPEYFPENIKLNDILRSRKTKEFVGPKSTYADPEYITLHKLLSFLHAALLMKGVQISYADLTRWVREGFLPLYGAHQLLPPTMPLSRADALVLGGVSTGRSKGIPSAGIFRQNTARLLAMLNITLIPKPPASVLASKIIKDLQLPDELISCIETLDMLVSSNNDGKWKLSSFGNVVDTGHVYAGALLLIALKLIIGLDGSSEFKISDFAAQVNDILKLKPSSSFSRRKSYGHQSSSPVKTLFVWREWVRFIEYRRITLEQTHVPTAIRKGVVHKMDPEYVLRFAKTEGFLHCHRTGKPETNPKEDQILKVLDQTAKRFVPSTDLPKRIPVFRPTVLGNHGLAEQLIEFDRCQFGLLEQDFSKSSLAFALEPKIIAEALKKADPPHKLKVCLGPAYNDVNLTMPFISSRTKMSSLISQIDRHGVKHIKFKPEIITATTKSDAEEEEEDEEDEDINKTQRSLLLFQPASGYWSRSTYLRFMSNSEWSLFSAELPETFVWMLNIICEIIEETPKDLYIKLNYLETIILMRHTKLEHSLTPAKILKHRLVSAMRSEI